MYVHTWGLDRAGPAGQKQQPLNAISHEYLLSLFLPSLMSIVVPPSVAMMYPNNHSLFS